ncbi:PREDICTED: homeobox protein MSH-A [Polistes canadensis]|uniref:homeobox protein MSH-A n=1 Tax=Polistes canadensis TaxID=91411 RepID=UPI000718CB78|nr:PREDICTED: homeobox protein MSH-A [Polistes canadensis]
MVVVQLCLSNLDLLQNRYTLAKIKGGVSRYYSDVVYIKDEGPSPTIYFLCTIQYSISLSSFAMNSSLPKSRSERSDFSIARILANDHDVSKDIVTSKDLNNCVDVVVNQLHDQSMKFRRENDDDIKKVSNLVSSRDFDLRPIDQLARNINEKEDNDDDGSNVIQESIAQSRSINTKYEDDVRREEVAASNEKNQRNELTWLQYTRYKPPKLPRRSFTGKNTKRRPGIHPRIPFSSFQLRVLEEKYKENAYLSRGDAYDISTELRLPESRVKIWFQNRRARDRRESNNVMAIT